MMAVNGEVCYKEWHLIIATGSNAKIVCILKTPKGEIFPILEVHEAKFQNAHSFYCF